MKKSSHKKQMFFFSNQSWKITAKGVVVKKKSVNDVAIDVKIKEMNYFSKINPKAIKLENDYFKIKKNDFHYDIEILEKKCDILNFLIQTSRMYWKQELIEGWDNKKARKKYYKNNLFNIAGNRLNEEQKAEQKAHLVNKIFTMGYLMHTYKDPSKAWAVYATDCHSQTESTGKTLFFRIIYFMLNGYIIDARNTRMWENNFLFDGVNKHTDYIVFDDADKNFRLANLYSCITGHINVNTKGGYPFSLPFKESPKLAITSVYPVLDNSPSATRRLLNIVFSDYYHDKKRVPEDDFGHIFFYDWNKKQWNKLFNFLAQCTRFYLSVNEKINPPKKQIL